MGARTHHRHVMAPYRPTTDRRTGRGSLRSLQRARSLRSLPKGTRCARRNVSPDASNLVKILTQLHCHAALLGIRYPPFSSSHFFSQAPRILLGTPVFKKIAIQKIGSVKMLLLLLFILICFMYPDFGRGVWQGFWGDDD